MLICPAIRRHRSDSVPLPSHGRHSISNILSEAMRPPAFVAGLYDLAMVGQAIEKRCRHLGVAKDARPFGEGEVGGDDNRRALVKPADQMEEQLPTGLCKGQIAEFVQHDEVETGQVIRHAALSASPRFALQPIDQIDDIVESAPGSAADAGSRDGNGQMPHKAHKSA
jgi:hypothetical protein